MSDDGLDFPRRVFNKGDKSGYVGFCRKGGVQPGSKRLGLKGGIKPWTAETPNTYVQGHLSSCSAW